jgi:hypothetical protein
MQSPATTYQFHRHLQLFYLLLVGCLLFGTGARAQKNDTLYFLNDDRISGEIKQYKYGHLTYKTYGVSTVTVKYDKISTFYSRKSYDILLVSGARRFGSFDTSNISQFVKIVTTNDTLLTPLIEVVEITPIKNKFWRRISGSVDLGFSYTKATTISQLTFNSDLKYTRRNYFTRLVLGSMNSIQQNVENSQNKKNDATLTFYHRIKNNWFGVGSSSAEQNSELGLELRLQGGAGVGNELVHTNSNNLLASGGVVVNKEWSVDTTHARINVDGWAGLQYRLFLFSKPEMEITSNAITYPSFNVANRWRLNYDIKFKFKIITDMFLSFSFYLNYDSKPPSAASNTMDYSFTSSFGYSF